MKPTDGGNDEPQRRRTDYPAQPAPSVTFNNQGMTAGSVQQSGRDISTNSPYTEGGGNAVVHNGSAPVTTYAPIPTQQALVLAVFANAREDQPLRLKREEEELRSCLAAHGERFHLITLRGCTPDELHRALLEHKPRFLHFAGHGTVNGLVFEDDEGSQQPVPRRALMGALANVPSLRCVLLNACHSAAHLQGLGGDVPYAVVAMRDSIADTVGRRFSQGFYDALAAGQTVAQAFQSGIDRLKLNAVDGADVPIFFPGKRAN